MHMKLVNNINSLSKVFCSPDNSANKFYKNRFIDRKNHFEISTQTIFEALCCNFV